jgi:hypothetical protein
MDGITPADLDLVELHDTASSAEIHLIEAWFVRAWARWAEQWQTWCRYG